MGYFDSLCWNNFIRVEYRDASRLLYLAIPAKTYQSLFRRDLAQDSARQYQVQLVVHDPDQELITQWPA